VIVIRSAWDSPFAILYAVSVGKMKASDMKDRIYIPLAVHVAHMKEIQNAYCKKQWVEVLKGRDCTVNER
jgi:hypothetical protein